MLNPPPVIVLPQAYPLPLIVSPPARLLSNTHTGVPPGVQFTPPPSSVTFERYGVAFVQPIPWRGAFHFRPAQDAAAQVRPADRGGRHHNRIIEEDAPPIGPGEHRKRMS